MNGTLRIMIVDDEPNIRLMTRIALEADGFKVVEAEDGEEAIDRLQASPVDLVLLDLRMPLLDGLETLRHLRAIGDRTPVVIVTAHGGVTDAVAAMKLGAMDVLQKPMTPQVLRRLVSEVIQRDSESRSKTVAKPLATKPASQSVRIAEKMTRARRALDRGEFDEAEFFLGQVQTLEPRSAEAARLNELLRESRYKVEGPYRFLRELFPVGNAK